MKDVLDFNKADSGGMLPKAAGKDMHLLDYINSYDDWEIRLKNFPFNLLVKHDGDYVLLKYNQLDSDMFFRVVREARGPIFKVNEEGKYEYVCRPFEKFFNYGEDLAAEVDWKKAKVTEKIDGSLMKLWFDKDKWHLSTNGTIDAFVAEADESGITFGEIFERALGGKVEESFSGLDTRYTYLFEMTSPETKIVIPYGDGIYYLSRIENETGIQERPPVMGEVAGKEEKELMEKMAGLGIKSPAFYALYNLEAVIDNTEVVPKDVNGIVLREGCVVNDGVNMIKVKSPMYFEQHHALGNGILSYKRIIESLKDESADDLSVLSPDFASKISFTKDLIEGLALKYDEEWDKAKNFAHLERRDFARSIQGLNYSDYLFKKYDNKDVRAVDFILTLPTSSIIKRLNIKEISIER